jgi:protein DEK
MTEVQNEEKIEETIEKTTEEEKEEKPAEENGVEDNENDDNNENESGEESSEEELGLLERPVEILERKRDRKSTDRLALEKYDTPKQDKEELDYTKGKGMKLGDITYIRHQIDKTNAEELKTLHRILFHKQGKITMIKKNIRSFCGYPFEKDSNHCKKVENQLDRIFMGQLKTLCGYLGQEKSGDKVAIKERLITYLLKPTDIEKSIPGKKAKSEKKSKSKKKSKPKKEAKSSEGIDEPSEASSDESDKEEGDEKEEKEGKKKEKKAASPKKKTPKKETAKKTEKKKKTPKQPAIKLPVPKKKKDGSPKKRKAADESEDDEPLVKKTKTEPTDAELKKVVSGILQGADLEQITMKTVVKQVYEKYPSFDLTTRKDFIKNTVKEIIS